MKAAPANLKSKSSVLSLVRSGPVSVAELVEASGLSSNAVRFHLETLEAEGLVELAGMRAPAGPGKPATLYMVTPDAELGFSRAYAPVLSACIAELRNSATEKEATRFLRLVGKRLGADVSAARKALPSRVRAASDFLNAIGGHTNVVRTAAGYRIAGRGCPLSAVVKDEPCICRVVEALVSEIVGKAAVECCDRTGRPNCCFEVSAA